MVTLIPFSCDNNSPVCIQVKPQGLEGICFIASLTEPRGVVGRSTDTVRLKEGLIDKHIRHKNV